MKKLMVAAALLVAAIPGVASAATIFSGGDEFYAYPLGKSADVPGTAAGSYECPLLSEQVKLGTSSNTVAGVACNETTNLVQVAVCHSGGSRSTGVLCSSDADPVTAGIQLPAGCADTTGNSSIPSFKAFSLVSSGGTMNENSLDQRCTTSQLTSGITWIN